MKRLRCMPPAAIVGLSIQLAVSAAAAAAPGGDAAGAAATGAGALAHCAAIAAADARLACYDGLAGRAVERPAPTVAAAPPDPHNFGIAQVRVNQPPPGPAAIQARVAQVQDNGMTRASVVLDNGQTWTFTESSTDASLSPGDPVTIKRAALGSFLLVTPAKHAYHVHRTR